MTDPNQLPEGRRQGGLLRFSDKEIERRIELNRQGRFGLETATREQLNIVWLLCRRWHLDPITDITLYQGHPWITLDGHLRLMREHPDFRGCRQQPLSEQEKLDGGWAKDDIVWATDITTARWGVITQWGKVTRVEINDARAQAEKSGKRSAPVGTSPVEIAQKRSLARAHKFAFGQDMPSEEEVEREVAEEAERRTDPRRTADAAAEYDRIWGSADPPLPAPPSSQEAVAQEPEAQEVALQQPPSEPEAARFAAWALNRSLSEQASRLKIAARVLRNSATTEQIDAANAELGAQIEHEFMRRGRQASV